jgi:hypothetical protein
MRFTRMSVLTYIADPVLASWLLDSYLTGFSEV